MMIDDDNSLTYFRDVVDAQPSVRTADLMHLTSARRRNKIISTAPYFDGPGIFRTEENNKDILPIYLGKRHAVQLNRKP